MHKFFLQIGALMGLLGVAIGAFGAHGLAKLLQKTGRVETFETAVKYQFYHALALLLVGVLMQQLANVPEAQRWLTYSGYSFLAGTLLFSGTLYVLCLTGITWLGAITPIGGVLMIAGWAMLWWALK
jgi:uncharacterized membrane protein YgdD (TMEM256/DUF423 family)